MKLLTLITLTLFLTTTASASTDTDNILIDYTRVIKNLETPETSADKEIENLLQSNGELLWSKAHDKCNSAGKIFEAVEFSKTIEPDTPLIKTDLDSHDKNSSSKSVLVIYLTGACISLDEL